MKSKFLTFAASLALLGIAGHFFEKPLMAAVSALTKNIDERGRNPYIQSVNCFTSTQNSCTVFFPAVPAGMRLVVEHVNMSVDTPTPLANVDISGNGPIIENPFLQVQGNDPAGNTIYIANQPFLTYYEAGQTPAISIFAKAGGFQFISSGITLTGYLVNLNN
jgi:hypothetical protein